MTTNNLIGYDPLAWMDGETLDETPLPPPVKKATKAKTKTASVINEPEEVVVQEAEEIVATEEPESDSPVATVDDDAVEPAVEHDEAAPEEIEVDVTIDEDGDVEITIDADKDVEVEVEVEIAVETPQTDDDVVDKIIEEVTEMPTEEIETEAEAEAEIVESEPEGIIEPLIELDSDATIKNIAALYDTIKRALAAHDTIEINAADVTTIDTATLQLLVSLKKDTQQSDKKVDIIYPSTRFIESAKLLNLLDVLEVTEV